MECLDQFQVCLTNLLELACRYPHGSWERQQYLTQIIRTVTASGKLWRDSSPYYEDALQQTWMYFCLNLCEATTAKQAYDPGKGKLVTWLNAYLKRRLQDFHSQQPWEEFMQNGKNLEQEIAAPEEPKPILEDVQQWVNLDPDGELRNTHLQGREDITCQLLILRRLPPETSWRDLSEELGVSISTLSSFYQRQCLPRLRQFGESNGYF